MPLSKDVTHSSDYSYYAIGIYAVLKMLSISSITSPLVCTSIYHLKYYLGYNFDSRRTDNYIQCGIDELINNKKIVLIENNKKNYVFDCSDLISDTDNGNFVKITYYELRKIFEVSNINNFLLFRYFIFLIGTINNSIEIFLDSDISKIGVVGNFTIDYLSEASGLGIRTIIEYNKILESIELIYIKHQNDFVLNDKNEIRQLKNVYGRFCDKDYIDAFALDTQKYNNSYKYAQKNVNNVNNNRRLAQMYNYLVKFGDKKYSYRELLDIYNYVLAENRKYELLYKKTKYEAHLNKIRDVDVFEKYDFYKEEDN